MPAGASEPAAASTASTASTASAYAPHPAAPAPATQAPLPAGVEPVALKVMNREIAIFRAPMLGIAPAERARRAKERIADQIASAGDHEVTVLQVPQGAAVVVDGALSFFVLEADADPLLQETAATAAGRAAAALRLAIADAHEGRSPKAILHAAGHALLATAVLAALLWATARARRSLERRALGLAVRAAGRLEVRGAAAVVRERTLAAVPRLVTATHWLVALLLAYEWLSFVLRRFPYTRAWGEGLNDYLMGVLATIGGAVLRAIPDLFVAGLIFVIARFVAGGLRAFFDRVQAGQIRLPWLEPDLAGPTRRIASAIVWLFALAMAYPYLPGAQTEAFRGLSVLVGLMISLGASSLVGQGASGLILTYARVFREGEYVRIGEHEGTVMEVGMFATRIRTGLGEELTLPNSLILANVTRNYSRTVRGAGFVLDTTVTIGYDTPWRQVHAMLVEAARRTDGVLADPPPRVFQTALSDFYPEYRLVCQAIPDAPRPRAEVLDALHANIQDVFNEHGVQIMSPHYLGDPGQPKVVPVGDWHRPPAAPEASPVVQAGRAS